MSTQYTYNSININSNIFNTDLCLGDRFHLIGFWEIVLTKHWCTGLITAFSYKKNLAEGLLVQILCVIFIGTDKSEGLRTVAAIHTVIWKSSECYGSQITKNREEFVYKCWFISTISRIRHDSKSHPLWKCHIHVCLSLIPRVPGTVTLTENLNCMPIIWEVG